jgi:hypothetical protein
METKIDVKRFNFELTRDIDWGRQPPCKHLRLDVEFISADNKPSIHFHKCREITEGVDERASLPTETFFKLSADLERVGEDPISYRKSFPQSYVLNMGDFHFETIPILTPLPRKSKHRRRGEGIDLKMTNTRTGDWIRLDSYEQARVFSELAPRARHLAKVLQLCPSIEGSGPLEKPEVYKWNHYILFVGDALEYLKDDVTDMDHNNLCCSAATLVDTRSGLFLKLHHDARKAIERCPPTREEFTLTFRDPYGNPLRTTLCVTDQDGGYGSPDIWITPNDFYILFTLLDCSTLLGDSAKFHLDANLFN